MKFEAAYFRMLNETKVKIISLVPVVALIIVFCIRFEMTALEYERAAGSWYRIALGVVHCFLSRF